MLGGSPVIALFAPFLIKCDSLESLETDAVGSEIGFLLDRLPAQAPLQHLTLNTVISEPCDAPECDYSELSLLLGTRVILGGLRTLTLDGVGKISEWAILANSCRTRAIDLVAVYM
jgi:hypothetical protein